MKFRTESIPTPTKGISFAGIKDQVVPDRSMSLKYILERFTRGEAVPVAHETSEGVQEEDLEKIRHADLVDKAEYKEKLEEVKKAYDKQEKAKLKKQRELDEQKAQEELQAKIKEEAKKLASGSGTT